jgi:hypothetical protein
MKLVTQKQNQNLVMGPKGGSDTKKNWPTDCRSQNQLKLQQGSLHHWQISKEYNGSRHTYGF